jgi:Zn-dependent peptidase ImmA (M78 family)
LAVQFRVSLSRLPKPAELEAAVSELELIADDYLELERITKAPLVRHYPLPYDITNLKVSEAAEELAAAERNRLGLGDGPLVELRETLEADVGIRIFALPLPSPVAALFAYSDEVGACIAINAKHPRERQRWSMAHEYGHFLTSRQRAEITVLFAYRRVPESERFADAFAARFLMPSTGLTRRFNDLRRARSGIPTAGDLLQLAHSYRVSFQALVIRLEDMDLLPSGTLDRLELRGFKPEQGRKLLDLAAEEPDIELLPLRYQYLAVEAYRQGLITEGQFARLLRRDRLSARSIAQSLSHRRPLTDEGSYDDIDIDLGEKAAGSKG